MFLTGFDAPCLNTLFVDKNLRYHGLIQAYSRTNRIYGATKTFGNIVTFRDLEKATEDAITLFGKGSTKSVILEKSYKEYMDGFMDAVSGEARRGFMDVVSELEAKFPDPTKIETQKDKKEFVKLFGEYLRVENALQNYDEFAALRALQDYRGTYNDIREWLRKEKAGEEKEKERINWDDVVFEVDLLKSQEINLDYILGLIFEHNKKIKDKAALTDEVRRIIRSSLENRSKEGLIVDFINQSDLDKFKDRASVIEEFFKFAKVVMKKEADELITSLNLDEAGARRFISSSLKSGFVSQSGTQIGEILPKISPLNKNYPIIRQKVIDEISHFVDKFKEVGSSV